MQDVKHNLSEMWSCLEARTERNCCQWRTRNKARLELIVINYNVVNKGPLSALVLAFTARSFIRRVLKTAKSDYLLRHVCPFA